MGRIRIWTNSEVDYLKENYSSVPDTIIAKHLSRAIGSIRWKAYSLNLKKEVLLGLRHAARIRQLSDPKALSWKSKFSSYKNDARIRNIPFKIDLEDFKNICSQNCHYCGVDPVEFNAFKNGRRTISRLTPQKVIDGAIIKSNGIDRKDSDGCYELSNCLPCCAHCNKAKLDRSYQEFIEWIEKLIKFRSNP